MSMRIFVTAGTGFVGSAVVRALLTRGHLVTALVRNPNKAKTIESLGASLLVGDMLHPSTYTAQVRNADVVIHCAQLTVTGRLTRKALTRISQADEIMTRALADECLAWSKPLIYTSGYFSYGDYGDEWITETTTPHPSPLGAGHQKMVDYLLLLHQQRQLKVVILTAGFVYGAGGLFKSAFYDTLRKGQLRIFGQGLNYWSPVHVEDLARAFVLASEGEFWGENFNIVDNQPLSLRQLVLELTEQMDHKPVGHILPWLVGLLIGAPLVDSLTTSSRVSNQKAKHMLGWLPHYPTFSAGLPAVLAQLNKSDK